MIMITGLSMQFLKQITYTLKLIDFYIFPDAPSEWALVATPPVFGVHVPVVSASLPAR